MGRNDRPEETAPPEIFYNDIEARKYTDNSRIISIQTALTERALELLSLPNDGTPKLLLDLGCGSGLSGEALTDKGHIWVVRSNIPRSLACHTSCSFHKTTYHIKITCRAQTSVHPCCTSPQIEKSKATFVSMTSATASLSDPAPSMALYQSLLCNGSAMPILLQTILESA